LLTVTADKPELIPKPVSVSEKERSFFDNRRATPDEQRKILELAFEQRRLRDQMSSMMFPCFPPEIRLGDKNVMRLITSYVLKQGFVEILILKNPVF
jgi:hypothetical protein